MLFGRRGRRRRAGCGGRARAAVADVPFDAHASPSSPSRSPRGARRRAASSTSAVGPLELELLRRARPRARRRAAGSATSRRPVAAAAALGAPAARSSPPARQCRLLADLAEGRPPKQLETRAKTPTRRARARRRSARASFDEPGELVGRRRDDRAAQALQAALEVDVRAVALEVARPGQHEVGPADAKLLEHRDRDHRLGALGERAHRRVAAASSPETIEQPIGSASTGSSSPAAPHASVTPRPFGVARQVEAPRRLPRVAVRERRAARRRRRPDRPRDRARAPRAGAGGLGCVARPDASAARRPRACAGARPRGRRSARARRPARRRARRRAPRRGSPRAAGGRRRARRASPRQHGRMRAEPGAQELGERVGLLDVSVPESAVTIAAPASRSSRSASSSASSHETASSPRRRTRRSGSAMRSRASQVREREAALVAEPALVDLGVVAREDPLDLPLARRRADVAADGAEPADGRHVLDLPRARLEAVLRRGQRADRAELDHVAGEAARGTARPRTSRSPTARRGSRATSWPSSATSSEKRVQR